MIAPAITVAQLKAFVGKAGADADEYLARAILTATRRAAQYLGAESLIKASAQVVVVVVGNDTMELLSPWQLEPTLTTLEYREATSVSSTDWAVVPARAWELAKRSGVWVLRKPSGLWQCNEYRLTGTNGQEVLDPALELAVMVLAARDYLESQADGGERLLMFQSVSRSYSQGASAGDTLKSAEDLERAWQSLLDPWRLPVV